MGSSTSKATTSVQAPSSNAQTPSQRPPNRTFTDLAAPCPHITFNITSADGGIFSKLPKELLFELLKQLSDKELLVFGLTCKFLHEKSSEDSLWSQILLIRDNSQFDEDYPRSQFVKLKHWYFFHKNKLRVMVLPERMPSNSVSQLTPKKVLLVGPSPVGKSQLLSILCGREFSDVHITTIGIDFLLSYWEFKGETQKMQIWDTAGQERFRTITEAYYRGAHIIVFVYSVANRKSFELLEEFHNSAKRLNDRCTCMILAATHIDLDPKLRVVTREEGKEWAEKRNPTETDYGKTIPMHYVEVSAKTGKGIGTLRRLLAEVYVHSEPPPVREALRLD
mmetsp:Transcript_9984/g.13714  ORF Transcript_9984/g.13714 Transcript_9984/m.13714 type:complete len:336 (-) Transcript_9984:97-1104(-)